MKSAQFKDSNKQNKKQYYRKLFSFEEDSKLMILVEKYKDNWKKIASEMSDRSVRQCKERYFHYLSPDIKRDEWSHDEDLLLLSSVEKQGKRWKALESIFEGRTEIDIRNRFKVLTRRISKKIRKDSLLTKVEIKSNESKSLKFEKKQNNEYNKTKKTSQLKTDQNSEQVKPENSEINCLNRSYNFLNYFLNAHEVIGSDISEDSIEDFMSEFCF